VIAVVHGVNLNLLGRRDPAQYGTLTLAELEESCRSWAREAGLEATCFQTNHEGALVEHLHGLAGVATGVILNPGAWTHYSYAIRDAAEFLSAHAPIVEVHLSNVMAREAFRAHSVLEGVAAHRIWGQGAEGYRAAIGWLAATR
jgi:3-dehydroquinate dehydratase-2